MDIIFSLAVLLFSVTVHEFAHGWMAYRLGDSTAKDSGRLTLNPLKHLDPIGSFIVPLILFFISRLSGGGFIFGWAKPVPFNPDNLRDRRWGTAKVAAAGPSANLLIALVFGFALRFLPSQFIPAGLTQIFSLIIFLNLLLAIFNSIPLPPLDGSKILFAFLPHSWRNLRIFLERYGMFLLLFLIFFAFQWILPLIFFIYQFIVGISV
ncbi:MAG: site-2 protease family protein [Candidatus Portnoybacteria bacterium CG23_combo_of_CG06-09_8_20_14_all_37_13]|uniref:Site-2 protease family protein n=2 Tax=Candidatus Portnoyibacteriota TaxID=1817913 RepID=A0A2M7BUI3_9BACT|nr:MAG: site-2 protease family protein [Candidatus Portnoybacteria bacterium CG23_combo_of_CG06-09_8_20_14_all_37_13]PIV10226.1 MAG: site-2 protease family protein [Candidatus Portnoybacteria bacterium CG03_land_8_20_14_0_80_41_10]